MFTQECKLFWLDLETTGRDPSHCAILEVAVATTDWNFENIQPLYDSVIKTSQPDLVHMNDYVRNMHTENGLLAAVESGEAVETRVAEELLLGVVEQHYTSKGFKPLLAGSSVHFDKGFLKNWMPRLHNALHYRIFDVSTLKAFREATTGDEFKQSSTVHRAMEDLLESIDAAQECAQRFAYSRFDYDRGYRDAMKWMRDLGLPLTESPAELEEKLRAHFLERGLGDLLELEQGGT